eukprot:6978065-Prorocentrum_lima.AAC.1
MHFFESVRLTATRNSGSPRASLHLEPLDIRASYHFVLDAQYTRVDILTERPASPEPRQCWWPIWAGLRLG